MKHHVLISIGNLKNASDKDLELAVDFLIMESGIINTGEYVEEQAARAEALAILSHELRRREKIGVGGGFVKGGVA